MAQETANVFGANVILDEVENRLGLRKTKRLETNNKRLEANNKRLEAVIGSKRPALGNITNQVGRVQPFRASKGQVNGFGLSKENEVNNGKTFFPLLSSQHGFPTGPQGFKIHVEKAELETSKPVDSTVGLKLCSSVANLRLPLHDIFTEEIITIEESPESPESPMVVDVSLSGINESTSSDTQEGELCVREYLDDIYTYLREAENKHRPKPNYMRRQPDITNSMRSILVDWLVEVSEEYKLHRETLFLAVNYIDRFLSQMSVLRAKLQLVGTACVFTASKYEEIYPPEVSEFVYITDDTYTKNQVLRMEHLVLKVLSFDIAVPTVNVFCDWYLKRFGADDKLSYLTMFLSELTMIDADVFLKYLPSTISSASLALANYTLNQDLWSPRMQEITNYTFSDVKDCLTDLHAAYTNVTTSPQQAVYEKYKVEDKYRAVSLIPAPRTLPC